MSQPLDRSCEHQPLVQLDREAGELHASTPFALPQNGENLSAYERNCFYLNERGNSFINSSFNSGADIDSDSRSAIAADFDADGRPDLLVGSVGGGPLRIFRNKLKQGKRLKIELIGRSCSFSGLGSRIKVVTTDGEIVRDIFPTNGFMGQGPIPTDVGIGNAQKVIRIEVRWPSGKTQNFTEIPDSYGDCCWTITENEPGLHVPETGEQP